MRGVLTNCTESLRLDALVSNIFMLANISGLGVGFYMAEPVAEVCGTRVAARIAS